MGCESTQLSPQGLQETFEELEHVVPQAGTKGLRADITSCCVWNGNEMHLCSLTVYHLTQLGYSEDMHSLNMHFSKWNFMSKMLFNMHSSKGLFNMHSSKWTCDSWRFVERI